MRIIRFLDERDVTQLGLDRGDGTAELLEGQMFQGLAPIGKTVKIARRLAPLVPTNIFCIGANYRQHCEETDAPIPEQPVIFMKPISALNHPGDPVVIPACCTHGPEVDYEVELAVIIGRPGKDISEADALDHIFGYTCANDISARRWQKHGGGGQWVRGKSFDTFCPLGPVLVTHGDGEDEISDPNNLDLSTTLNGERMQHNNTSDMIFNVRKLIAFLSQDTTLMPGTVILTGTPEGVGLGRNPHVFLKPGDEVTVEIEKIGRLTNPVKAAGAA